MLFKNIQIHTDSYHLENIQNINKLLMEKEDNIKILLVEVLKMEDTYIKKEIIFTYISNGNMYGTFFLFDVY